MTVRSTKRLVSVIVPAFDRPQLLTEALRSVCWQTYRPLEIVVVDDGSETDIRGAVDLATASADVAIVYLRQSNHGSGHARQVGLEASSGPLTQYLDSDDLLLPRKIEEQVRALEARPDAIMAYNTTLAVDGDTGQWLGYYQRSNERHCQILPAALRKRPWGTNSGLWRFEKERRQPAWASQWHEGWRHDVLAGAEGRPILHLTSPSAIVRRFRHGHLSTVEGDRTRVKRRLTESSADVRDVLQRFSEMNALDATARETLSDRLYVCAMRLIECGEVAKAMADLQLAAKLCLHRTVRMQCRLAMRLARGLEPDEKSLGCALLLALHDVIHYTAMRWEQARRNGMKQH